MSVIVARALPDARDGLKPVQRRILFAMREMGLGPQARFVKSARVVGEVLGKFHPHGDQAVYDTLVRMAQPFSLRYPLVRGQGNFGSLDGDSAAAMRYTETRLQAVAELLLADIDKDTVPFVPNYDGTRTEPLVMPSAFPHLLANGALGIAVGMSTAIPPHNLSELISGCLILLDKPAVSNEDLISVIRGPDFPGGGILYNAKDLVSVYAQGKGPIVIRGRAEIETSERKTARIVVTEIPYEVRKAAILEQIVNGIRDRKLEGIRDVRDESGKEGVRVVVELRQDATPQVVLAALFKYTDLQRTYHLNLLALEGGIRPKLYSLKELLEEFLDFRRELIRKRSLFELARAKERLHILEGLAKALQHIDAVIKLIRASRSREDAHQAIRRHFKFSDVQATAILAMPLAALARLERDRIAQEKEEKRVLIDGFEDILKNPKSLVRVLKKELSGVVERFGDERKTEIKQEAVSEIQLKDLVSQAPAVIAMTSDGYIKRLPPSSFRVQQRGGKGVSGMDLNESEALAHMMVVNTHDRILLFTDTGRVFSVCAYEIPEASRTSRGRALVNVLSLAANEQVQALVAVSEDRGDASSALLFVTERGVVKRMPQDAFHSVRKRGMGAITLAPKDVLVSILHTNGSDDILILTQHGQALRFLEKDIRFMGRAAAGIRGIRLRKDDLVVGALSLRADTQGLGVLLVGERGFGKLVETKAFKRQRRGGTGLRAMPTNQNTGNLVGVASAPEGAQEAFAVSRKGLVLRLTLRQIKALSRSARGVRLMRLDPKDAILAVRVL